MRKTLPSVLLAGLLAACGSAGQAEPDQRLRVASAALATGNPGAAIGIAGTLAAENPGDAAAQLRHAEMLAEAGRWQEAVQAYDRAVRADGTSRLARLGLGRARLRGGDVAGAEASFREAIAALPREPGAQSGLGVTLDLQGRHEEAQAAYRAALALDPAHAGARTNLALSLTLSGHGQEAVRMLETVARAPQATPRQRHNLALAYAAAGDAPRAAEMMAPELGEDSRDAAAAWRAALAGS
ncbi:tetratricopeptide repeat protein [Roseomonas eburnea]|uniref:Tetratricopeptide repeat protein n=1 Tax=Neoroseomonas eburnea TaxID=1346889 RepID=A0A9X9XA49_9PROT|nr:tetratricopeptide repeat protein [Neoroseomonas eburnea]MBR0680585.1 tetratricopeptide repeat protein [Neoroseomonas eburnea]